jgi:hypothetical protein
LIVIFCWADRLIFRIGRGFCPDFRLLAQPSQFCAVRNASLLGIQGEDPIWPELRHYGEKIMKISSLIPRRVWP